MDPEQLPEFELLRTTALHQLHAGDWQLRLSILPSFGDPQVAGVRRLSHDELTGQLRSSLPSTLAERRTWHKSIDHKKLATPVERLRHPRTLAPTVEIIRTAIDQSWLVKKLAELQHISLPALPASNMVGLDGTAYELLAHTANHWSQFHWWSTHPAAWQPLLHWFDATWASLNAFLHAQNTDPQPPRD